MKDWEDMIKYIYLMAKRNVKKKKPKQQPNNSDQKKCLHHKMKY